MLDLIPKSCQHQPPNQDNQGDPRVPEGPEGAWHEGPPEPEEVAGRPQEGV